MPVHSLGVSTSLSFLEVLGIECRVPHVLGKCSPTELSPVCAPVKVWCVYSLLCGGQRITWHHSSDAGHGHFFFFQDWIPSLVWNSPSRQGWLASECLLPHPQHTPWHQICLFLTWGLGKEHRSASTPKTELSSQFLKLSKLKTGFSLAKWPMPLIPVLGRHMQRQISASLRLVCST